MSQRLIQIRIQHWPGRPQGLERLLERAPSAEVIVDDAEGQPNPWRGYKKCLSNLPSSGHVAVLQDDTVPCVNFERALELVVSARPDSVISLFVAGLNNVTRRDYLRAMQREQRWTEIYFRDIHHVCALVWPVEKAREFLAWAETARIPGHSRIPRSDDAIVGTWSRYTKNPIWATIPSLVQHPDDVPSTIGRKHYSGMERGRTALQFIGDADPLDLDWSAR